MALNDATQQRFDSGAGDKQANASFDPFKEFLDGGGSQEKGNAFHQTIKAMEDGMAGGDSAFNALPKVDPMQGIEKNDKSFDVAAAMAPDHDLQNLAMDRALQNT